MRQRFFWIFIFLCTAFSTRAQQPSEGRLRAVELEKLHYTDEDPSVAEDALFEKALLLDSLGDRASALSTLRRVSIPYLPEDKRAAADSLLAAWSEFAAGEATVSGRVARKTGSVAAFRKTSSSISAAGASGTSASASAVSGSEAIGSERAAVIASQPFDRYSLATFADLTSAQPKGKLAGSFWAFVPPVGHFIAGEYGRGSVCFLLDAAELAFGVWQVCSGHWITGYLIGAVGLDITYFDEASRLVPILKGED